MPGTHVPDPSPTPPDLAALERLAVDAATTAADLLLDGLHERRARVDTKSTGTDMVTEMDQASEQLLTDALLAARPDDGILGEEGTDRPGTSGVRWVIDPLDGTTNYLYRLPGFAVSVAAEVEGATVVGVVVDPMHGHVYAATRGGGARRDGAAIRCSDQDDLATALVATGFAYDPARRGRQAAVLAEVLPRIRDIRRLGAAAVDLCLVASGVVDAYFERGLAPWDHAAGALIAAEAGAVVGHLDGGPPSSDFAMAAAPGIDGAFRDLLRAAGAAA